MTDRELRREFERIEGILQSVAHELVEAPHAVCQWPDTLRSSLAALEKIRDEGSLVERDHAFHSLLRRIQARVEQVSLFLDSALLFYCGCVAIRMPQPGSYTHEGALQEQFASGGRMQLEA
jgi:hypothetical protein